MEHIKKHGAFYALLVIIITYPILDSQIIKLARSEWHIEKTYQSKLIKTVRAEAYQPTMKEWVLDRVEESGLDRNKVDCLLWHESHYYQYAINKNSNGTFDTGLWQINDIHNISREDTFDYKKATEWSIKKIKHDGNYEAWYAYRTYCK